MDIYWIKLILIGLSAGISSAFFGIGGGIIIVPALTYFMGFVISKSVGTSLMAMLPPVGALAVYRYYQSGNVDVKAGLLLSVLLILGSYLGAVLVNNYINPAVLKTLFGIFLITVGCYIVVSNLFNV